MSSAFPPTADIRRAGLGGHSDRSMLGAHRDSSCATMPRAGLQAVAGALGECGRYLD